ncbi:uncharacterized protein [Penaeus vannamei]|uniref:uncharacterized protein isoform X2 n=1 Tax=Penaeus vannamei TaxID=6689 RepID=UPI00387FA785
MDPGVPPSPPPPYEEFLYGRPAEPASTTVPQLTTYNTLHDYVQAPACPGPPPRYEEPLFGRPAEPASTAVPQLTTYNTLHDYVQLSSAAPSAPLVPSSSIPASYWTYHGLDQLASLRQVCVSDRKHDSYRVTDTTKTLLFTAALEMESVCLCCNSEKGPGMNFYLLTSADQKVLLGNRIKSEVCCSDPVETVTVSRPPDVKIGTVEGHGKNFALKNASGDTLCSLEMEDRGCCDCSEKIYQVQAWWFPLQHLTAKAQLKFVVMVARLLSPLLWMSSQKLY